MNLPFSSICYPMGIDTGLGRLSVERSYEEHVDQMIRQLLLTAPGERINRPEFGCGVRRMLFAPNSDVSASLSQVLVHQALDQWLGSVLKVDQVTVEAVDSTLTISLSYVLLARQQRRYLNLEVAP
ncbi:GPW/gp25 family protein [Dyella humicola]|uniref:GPW/gp25 family protein n=1 Tax=Dyella humicola TaxID=2992126 RepID=UPI00225A8821|nr:GPW/gp25 family protein [Dyella humicola]